MRPDMHIIEAERSGEITRFVVGCPDQSRTIVSALKARRFSIRKESFGPEPERAESERLRATRILGEIFGH